MRSVRNFGGNLWFAALVLLAAPASLRAQGEQLRERQVLDPASDEWRDEPSAPRSEAAGALGEARSLLARGEPKEARKILKQWVKDNPDDEQYYEGVWLLGETYFETKDFWAALQKYEEVAQNTSGELFAKANRRAMDVGRAFMSGEPRILWKIFRLPARDDGVTALDRVYERVPGTRMGEEALRLKAGYYFERGDLQLAQDEYDLLVREFPSGRYTREAMLRSAESAEAAYPGNRYDDRPLVEAEERYRQVQSTFPQYAERELVPQRLEGIRQARADKLLQVARWYQKTGQGGAAEFYYRHILKTFGDTLAGSEARNLLRGMGIDVESEAPKP